VRPSLPVLFEDDAFVVVAKPSGMIVHRGWARDDDDALRCVRDQLGHHVFAVHRLDRGTSGTLLFAKASAYVQPAADALRSATACKTYLALVRGHMRSSVDVDHAIPRGERGDRVEARTTFDPVASSPEARCCLVRARPRTGRTHQIRRHLKHLSHPIVGDVRYGKGPLNREFREQWGLHRLALHALRLELPHPLDPTAPHLRVEAPLPCSLTDPLSALGVWPR
jgi:tRNA pseudouridine65 synthase